jgi:AcrR family transcriptional regulator
MARLALRSGLGTGGVPKIAERARAARREQIIAAGLACFARSGYHAATMADVAAQAGVSKGTPYLYFASKQALFLALHEEWDCGAGQRVDKAIAALPGADRVLKPSGLLYFLEHVRADTARLARIQRALDVAVWPHLFGSCHLPEIGD